MEKLQVINGFLNIRSGEVMNSIYVVCNGGIIYLKDRVKEKILLEDDVFGVLVGGEYLYYNMPVEIYYDNIENETINNVFRIRLHESYNECVISFGE